MVDEVLSQTGGTERRLRELPSRVVVYLLLAAGLFAELGYRQVWSRLVAGLDVDRPVPSSSALAQARRRVGVAPLKALFELLAGPAAGAVRWRGLLVCAIDGTTMSVPDSPDNLARYGHQSGSHGGSGFPLVRLLAVVSPRNPGLDGGHVRAVEEGRDQVRTRSVRLPAAGHGAAGGPELRGQRPRDPDRRDRRRSADPLQEQPPAAPADDAARRFVDLDARRGPDPGGRRADHGGFSGGGHRTGRYRLITTLLDHHRYPALEIVDLYHRRWEIETAFRELKSTVLGGRVLRARTPQGVDQEIYALLAGYQALRTAMADATSTDPAAPDDRASFTIALNTARDQIIHAAGIITGTTIDLTGRIGRAVLADLLPGRRTRSSPRVVKRAISKHRAKGPTDRTNHRTTINIDILTEPELTTTQDP